PRRVGKPTRGERRPSRPRACAPTHPLRCRPGTETSMRFVLCLALLGACTTSYTSITERPGTACETDADCRGGVCVDDVGGRICTSACTDLDPSATCVSGWTCGE